jgi:hypothetical protein
VKHLDDRGFTAWFVFVALLSVAWVAVLIWLVVTVIGWLGRH